MYRIGEFSYLCETTVKTLRHYEKIGLLKPQSIDSFTGYRYYDKNQLERFNIIKSLQEAGLTLKEIKEYIENPSSKKLEFKIKNIESESEKKLNLLKNLKIRGNNMKYELTNKKITALGIITIIKNRSEIEEKIKEVDNMVKVFSFITNPIVFINYEAEYKNEDIFCFIGRKIKEEERLSYEIIQSMNKGLVMDGVGSRIQNELNTKLITLDKDEYSYESSKINDVYKNLITYANENNIQIRSPFIEIYSTEYTEKEKFYTLELLIEARDLSIENEIAIRYNKHLKEKLKNIHDKKYIGTWILQGEITEIRRMFDKNRKHYMPDTNLTKITLKSDGTTNFKNITWKEDYLIITDNDTTIYDRMALEDNDTLEVLVNMKETNSIPYIYYYTRSQDEKI